MVAVTLFVVCVLAVLTTPALAVTAAPGWEVTGRTFPTNLPPGGKGAVQLDVYNTGAASSTEGATVTDVLPAGVTFTGPAGKGGKCSGTTVVTCTLPAVHPGKIGLLGFGVSVAPGVSGTAVNSVTVAGGGALTPASVSDPFRFDSSPPAFGFAGLDAWFTNADGTPDTQAGSHPYEVTVAFDLNNLTNEKRENDSPAGGIVKNIDVNLPPGIVGDPNAVPQCTRGQLDQGVHGCPLSTQIGVEQVGLTLFENEFFEFEFPVYNMVPPPGVPAQFAFIFNGIATFLDAGVRSGGDYGITEHTDHLNQQAELLFSTTTIWGVPAEASHDAQRKGAGCEETLVEGEFVGCASGAAVKPFLTLPTSCVGPQTFTTVANTWQDASVTGQASVVLHDSGGNPVGFTGCDHLGFAPSIGVAPDTSFADTPAGLTVEVKTPQEGLSNVGGLGVSNIQDTTVTLPEGMVINPGQAAGLAACQSFQDGVGTEEAPSCPLASKVGTVAIETPLLKDKLEGNVYVLQSNPPNLQLLVAASGEGVNIKLVGSVHLDESTGRLTSTFSGTPELPFTDFKLAFSGGAQAALVTPLRCGVYTTSSDFTPWSSPFVQDVFPQSGFQIDAGPGGSACPSTPLPFAPSLIAGSTTDQAGGYTNFSLLLQRADGQQRINGLQFKTPEGLLGMISKIPLCGEPQAAQGTCSPASQIGHTVVQSGPGPYPLVVPQPGEPAAPIYLTGSYKGAPYGLSIAVPVITGPFNLGTVVVRSRIEVDPLTSQLTVTTDPLPLILDGVPTDLRTINAVVDRPEFMFNPTNCAPMSFSGTAFSAQGAAAAISSHFQMGSCQSLKFKPDFRVSTAGKTSRKNGASLDVKILYPTGPAGNNQASSQSNIGSVKVDLPKQLPSRLTTLQKACPAATFEANPAGCPADSRVGEVSAVTPVLPVKLTGPAYFVSYGGAKFPELVFVLQGYGVTVDVHGETFINKAGITSSTFRHVPDVPIYSFELKLPQGPFSALAANGNLCKSKLKMPTVFTAQDGAVIHQTTPITVTGCGKAKKKGKRASARHKSKRGKK